MINLRKGEISQLNDLKFKVGLGWETKADLDLSVFMLNENKLLPKAEFFVFYGNEVSADGSITHSGDDLTGESSEGGDDETVDIDLTIIDPQIKEIIFLVSIHEATLNNLSFGKISDAYIRILNSKDEEIIRYDLHEDFSVEKSVIFGKLAYINKKWEFQAVGQGFNDELDYHVTQYYSGVVIK